MVVVDCGAEKPRRTRQGAGGENVLGSGAMIDGLHHDGWLALVQPLIPVAHREVLIHPDVVFAVLMLRGDFLVGLVVQRIGIGKGLEQNPLAVRTPLRVLGARGNSGEAARFAALREIENKDLFYLVAFALGGASNAGTVGGPIGVGFRS